MRKGNVSDVVNPGAPDDQPGIEDATNEGNSGNLMPKLLIAPIAILIASMLIGLPLLRILSANGDDDALRMQAAIDARGQVALLFSSALLESRSATIAGRYAVSELHPQVDDIVADLRRRDADELRGALATTERVACQSPSEGHECFVARLARRGESPVIEIRITVGIVGGAARVIAIERGSQALLS